MLGSMISWVRESGRRQELYHAVLRAVKGCLEAPRVVTHDEGAVFVCLQGRRVQLTSLILVFPVSRMLAGSILSQLLSTPYLYNQLTDRKDWKGPDETKEGEKSKGQRRKERSDRQRDHPGKGRK